MKALFLVPRIDKASTRFRVLQYLPFLEKRGWDCVIIPLSKSSRNWPELFRQLRRADVVVVQKKLFSAPELWLIRRAVQHLIYDFDDAVMFKEGACREEDHPRQQHRFIRTVKAVDQLIAGNHFLAEQASRYHAKVTVIPTPVDADYYQPATQSHRDEVVIGWIGSRGTLKYLKELAPALNRLATLCPQARLKIVADDFFSLDQMPVVKKNWVQDEEVADLQTFDVGIMPLSDDLWTRGKCGFKLLQCMAVGRPVVCSPVGVNQEIVSHNIEGFWAANVEEWVMYLKRLIDDAGLRSLMGARARQTVEARYSLQVCAPRIDMLLRSAISPGID